MRNKIKQSVRKHIHQSSRVVLALAVSATVMGCGGSSSGDTATSASLDVPPLPPSTETSIAVLVSHSEQLGLSEEQTTALATMESDLNARNEPLQAKLLEMQTAPKRTRAKASDGEARSGRGGMSRGGGGGRGGRGGAPPSSGNSGADDAAHRDREHKREERSQQIRAEMMSNNAASLEEAFGLLGDLQKDQAAAILEKEGHQSPEPPPSPESLDASGFSQP